MESDLKLTYGLELELADWSRTVKFPNNIAVKDVNDITVANSDGTCVNPYSLEGRGGEICTTPSNSITEAIDKVGYVFNRLDQFSINHTCWLHIHVGLESLYFDTLDKLKQIASYCHINSKEIRDYTSICPVKEGPKMKPEDRIRRNLTRTSTLTELEFQEVFLANSIEEFWKPYERKRHLVNIVPLKYQGTVEFRCFYMSDKLFEIRGALEFCRDFITSMLTADQNNVVDLLYKNSYSFPKPIEFDYKIEEVYKSTLVEKRPKLNNFTGKEWGLK